MDEKPDLRLSVQMSDDAFRFAHPCADERGARPLVRQVRNQLEQLDEIIRISEPRYRSAIATTGEQWFRRRKPAMAVESASPCVNGVLRGTGAEADRRQRLHYSVQLRNSGQKEGALIEANRSGRGITSGITFANLTASLASLKQLSDLNSNLIVRF